MANKNKKPQTAPKLSSNDASLLLECVEHSVLETEDRERLEAILNAVVQVGAARQAALAKAIRARAKATKAKPVAKPAKVKARKR